jgi:hypothetical protein
MIRLGILTVLAAAVAGAAQSPLVPQGNCSIESTPVPLGGMTTMKFSGAPFAPFLVVFDSAPGAFTYPGIGTVWLGLTPNVVVALDGFATGYPTIGPGGQSVFTAPVANAPAFDGVLVYGQAVALDPGSPSQVAFSNAKSFQFGYPDSYHSTLGSLGLARAFHRTVPLPDGSYLVVGGGNGALLLPVASTSCEIYNPYLRTFAPAASMAAARTLHTATALDDGRILVTGGCLTFGAGVATAEIYEPASGTWSAPIPMNATRIGHAATKLTDGRVLLTGGASSFVLTPPTSTNYLPIFQASQDTAEIFDPATSTFTPAAGPMHSHRFGHAACVLPSGRVLISGGVDSGTTIFGTGAPIYATNCDVFEPASGTFTQVANMGVSRVVHTLNLLPNGGALAVGGAGGTLVVSLSTSELFDEATGAWSPGPSLPASQTLALHTATPLANGDLSFAGGAVGAVGAFQGVAVAYTFSSQAGFTPRANLPSPRQAHTAISTPEGILILGGADQGQPTATPPVSAQAVGTALLWTPN